MITKDQASDLKSAIDHAAARALELQTATLAKQQADRALEAALWALQQKDSKQVQFA